MNTYTTATPVGTSFSNVVLEIKMSRGVRRAQIKISQIKGTTSIKAESRWAMVMYYNKIYHKINYS